MRYLARRLINAVLVLFAVSVLAFIFSSLAPGDFFAEMRMNPQLRSETVAALRAQYGIDQPLVIRYVRWLKSACQGEFGYSFAYNRPVGELLLPRARNTLLLSGLALLFIWLIALPVGTLAGVGRFPLLTRTVEVFNAGVLAIPELVLALAVLWIAARTRWIPLGGMVSLDFSNLTFAGKVADWARHLLLPLSVMVLIGLPAVLRHVRAAVSEVSGEPFMRFARGHGIPRARLYGYALRTAANPLISLLSLSIGTLLSASLLVEIVMGWPGIGPLFIEAILARDLFVVVDTVLLSSVFLTAGNFFADVLLFAADPRIRVK
jgi:peptide/nickel transport system permease protein